MAYTKTNWVNEGPPAIDADNLNKIENGIYTNSNNIDNLLSWAGSPFVIEEYSSTKTIAANGYASMEETKTKSGYMPIGVLGFNITGTGSSAAQVLKNLLSARSEGSCTVLLGLKNDSGSSVTWTLYSYVLWLKIL